MYAVYPETAKTDKHQCNAALNDRMTHAGALLTLRGYAQLRKG